MLEPDNDQAQDFLNRLILEGNNGEGLEDNISGSPNPLKPYTTVIPTAGFCLKTKNKENEKIFINICNSESVPCPQEMTDDELIKLLESDDPTHYRIPMSIGAAHAELDKSGNGCTAYDVIVNPTFYKKMESSELFKTFFLTVMIEGVEGKYNQEISREWVTLKNRKFIGDLTEQYVRESSKRLISEIDDNININSIPTQSSGERKNKIEEIQPQVIEKKRAPEPKFIILQEPVSGHPEYLVAEIHLPQVKTSQTLEIDLGEDRIVLDTRSNVYYLDIYLPYLIQQDECGAQFDRKTKILTLTMPVQPDS